MTYNETMSGGVKVSGCPVVTFIKTYQTLFASGDVVFNVHKARRGLLEKIVIKSPKLIQNIRTGGTILVMYVDTFNALWNEYDLISHSQAIALATAYYEDLLEDLEEIDKC